MNMKLSASIASGEMGVTRWILLTLALVTAFFSYQGLALDADGFEAKGRATVFAIGTGAFVYGFWEWSFRAVRDWETPKAKALGLAVIAAVMVMITALSSQFNVAGVNGGRILTHHNELFVNNLSEGLSERTEAISTVEGFGADVRQSRDRYAELGATERKTGTASGSPGVGAVSNALISTSGRLDRLAGEIITFVTIADAAGDAARERLDRIRAINVSDMSYSERSRLIKQESDLLRADFAKMDAANLNAIIARTVNALPNEIRLLEQYSRNPNTKAQQAAALERLRVEIQGTSDALRAALSDESVALAAPAQFQLISPTKAIRVYWTELVPEWAGGLALDWAPLALLGLMMISLNGLSSDKLEQIARMKRLSAYDLMIAVQAMHGLNDARADEEVVKNMKRAAYSDFKGG